MKCNKCSHINEPKNLEFDKVIRIPDKCFRCVFSFLPGNNQDMELWCNHFETYVKRDNKPDWCELVYIEIWKKKEQE